MKRIPALIFVLVSSIAFSQNSLIKQWDYRFGGSDDDFLNNFQQTVDGGFILAGFSQSPVSGDKSKNTRGIWDYWLVKIDALGIKQWDKDLGGTQDDRLYSMQQTTDGGYILGGSSNSGIGGDKTEGNWDSVNFSHDFWIIKTDSIGNRIWDKDIGGLLDDNLVSIEQTNDGGFIAGGSSYSGIGGNKTYTNWDTLNNTSDFWIVKLNSAGQIEWDKDFGTTGDDQLTCIRQASDGGFIIAGQTSAGMSGDKTQASFGQLDYWVIKIDSLGNKIWDSDFGGSEIDIAYSMKTTPDGGCIIAGVSSSGLSGNKTQPNWDASNTTFDYWIVKVNSSGSIEWDKDFGGTLSEPRLGSITQTIDSGYLIAGISYSSNSGNKTESNLGIEQEWVVKTDSLGMLQWEKTVFTTAEDEFGFATQSSDGCFLTANGTPAGIGGDKTQASWGFNDYWIAKFCDSTLTAQVDESSLVKNQLFLFPNPTPGKITASGLPVGVSLVEIYDLSGEKVMECPLSNAQKDSFSVFDLSQLASGIYMIRVTGGEKKLWGKLVRL